MTKFRNWFCALAAVLSLGLGVAAPSMAADDDEDRHGMVNDMPIPVDDEEAVKKGGERFKERCAYCHLANGRGGSSAVCLACQKYKHGSRSSQIYATIAAGKPYTKMGAFASSLSQEEMMNIIAYIRFLQEWKIKDDKAARAAEASPK